jgi:hypothetical protein
MRVVVMVVASSKHARVTIGNFDKLVNHGTGQKGDQVDWFS